MKKILLVNTNMEKAPYPVAPLGMCMLATATEQAGYEVISFDGMWTYEHDDNKHAEDALMHILQDFQPDVIGVSVRNIDDMVMEKPTYYVDEIEHHFIVPIQKFNKGITVLGGAGFSLFPEELLDRWQFDYGIIGAGEVTFLKLLKSLENGTSPDKIPGVLVHNASHPANGLPVPGKKSNMSILTVPYSHIDTHLNYTPYQLRGSYPVQTKRGCALKCLYCSYPAIEGKTYQLRTPEDVVDEIEDVQKRLPGVMFEIVDSTFNHPPAHAENICREIIRRQLKLSIRTMGVNPAGVTPELMRLMQQAGFKQIDCTPDSASEKMLRNLHKGFTRRKLEETAHIIRKAGMPTMWFFVLGGPGETDETLDETFDFIRRYIDPHDLVYLTEGLRIYPKTGLEKMALEEGYISNCDSLLTPVFYVSPLVGRNRLKERVKKFISKQYNCLRSVESSPSQEMIQKALEIRQRENLTEEPMFRTLLRVRKEEFYT